MKLRSSTSLGFVVALSAAVAVALAGRTEQTVKLPFGKWTRASETPILSPQGATWESAGTFNPAVVLYHGKIVMLYRAQDAAGTSRLGYAESKDGIHFTRRPEPVLAPKSDYEKDGGVEDPRLQKFGRWLEPDVWRDTYYLTYTGYNKKDAQLCLATSRDLIHWERKGVILPAYKGNWNKGWTKSGAIVPEEIDGKYWMYWLGTAADKTDQMGLSWSTDLIHWTEATQTPVLPKRPGKFDSRVVEPGPPPIFTHRGILLIYNGGDDELVYRTGVAIFDRNDPRKLLWRTDVPIFAPEKEWEKTGQVPNVVFVEGMLSAENHFFFYYGGADKYVGVAEARERQESPSTQAQNDYDLSPSHVLSNAMKEAGKEFELKIYPPFGDSVQDGHPFGYFGGSVWADDVFRFLNKHCKP